MVVEVIEVMQEKWVEFGGRLVGWWQESSRDLRTRDRTTLIQFISSCW